MLLSENRLRAVARRRTSRLVKRADVVLAESMRATTDRFDVFLSHSSKAAELVLGAKTLLEDECGFTVYVDWAVDPQLRQGKITTQNAHVIRRRMRQCKMLLYLKTENSPDSKWMPWELGYFDALGRPVGIFPVASSEQNGFEGHEYLGLYPYVDEALTEGTHETKLYVNKSRSEYGLLEDWLDEPDSIRDYS